MCASSDDLCLEWTVLCSVKSWYRAVHVLAVLFLTYIYIYIYIRVCGVYAQGMVIALPFAAASFSPIISHSRDSLPSYLRQPIRTCSVDILHVSPIHLCHSTVELQGLLLSGPQDSSHVQFVLGSPPRLLLQFLWPARQIPPLARRAGPKASLQGFLINPPACAIATQHRDPAW